MPVLRDTKVHFLKLVETGDDGDLPIVVDTQTGEQRSLFAAPTRKTVIFVNASAIRDQDFRTVLEASTGGTLLDVRVAPRFDIGTINRAKTFNILDDLRVVYVDYCGLSGIRAPDDPRLAADVIAATARSVHADAKRADFTLCLLLDGHQLSDEFISSFMGRFVDEKTDWDVLVVPQRLALVEPAAGHRTHVFISHAAPEDNGFATWIAARLRIAGYDPWVDVSELRAGEAFWSAIENSLRDQAAIVLVVLSRDSVRKEGVLNEIHFAQSLERARGLKGFIIPLRVDGLGALDMPIQLQRRQYIDFSRGWASGLRVLLGELSKKGVPRQEVATSDVSSWLERSLSLRSRIANQLEELVSNWLPIPLLPPKVFLHEPPTGTGIREFGRLHGDGDPLAINGRWCTFARQVAAGGERSALLQLPATISYDVNDWINAEIVHPPCGRRVVRRRQMVDLLRRVLDREFENNGMHAFELSNRRRAWYFEHGALPNDRVNWIDSRGKSRRKNIVGYSSKKSVYWHLAIEAKPVLSPKPLIILKMHVVFSANGRTPLGDATKMHALRRRFCKSWWNDSWRDLMLAALFELSKGSKSIIRQDPLLTGGLHVGSSPMKVPVPFSVISQDATEEMLDEDVEVLLAEDEDWMDGDFVSAPTNADSE